MTLEDLAQLSRRDRLRVALLVAALIVAIIWAAVQFMEPAPPRRIVLASGPQFGLYHRYAQRYKARLARDGVTVEERMTDGAAQNVALLHERQSGVDVAFVQGGAVAPVPDHVVMIASLYYEPLWIFYRRPGPTLTQLTELHGKRIAVGVPGSGTRAMALRLLAANGLSTADGTGTASTAIVDIGGEAAFTALRSGSVDAVLLVGGVDTPIIASALRDPAFVLMSLARADAYPRRFPFLTRLGLPQGTIDFALDIPHEDVRMISSEAMLAARDDLHPALITLLLDAAREIHSAQGIFETAGEFPNVTPVDLPVSVDAERHFRFGPSFLHRYLPFWLATVLERTIVLIVPLLVVLIPLFNHLPQLLRWRIRKRIFRWYGELVLLERDIGTRKDPPPLAQWQQDLDRIERAVGNIRTPASFASEAYTLREHVALVRRTLAARKEGATAPGA
jgi:TRAP-type uncharacterized transport system substrate-binding protein